MRRGQLSRQHILEGVKALREEEEEDAIRKEKTRDKCNLHNFTNLNIENSFGRLLGKNGGYVPDAYEDDNTIRNITEIRWHIEKALLKYSLSITGQKKSKCGKNNPVSNRKKLSTTRQKIR